MSDHAGIAWSRHSSGSWAGPAAIWSFAAAAALAAHAGLVWWAVRQPAAIPAEAPGQAAIMIELAAAPVAPEAQEDEISPDRTDARASPQEVLTAARTNDILEPVEPQRQAVAPTASAPVASAIAEPDRAASAADPGPVLSPIEPEPTSVVEARPVEPVDEAAEQEAQIADLLARVEVPLPSARPEPPSARPAQAARTQAPAPREQAHETRRKQAAPSRAASKAKLRTERAPQAAAAQSSRGASASLSPERWQSRLLSHLERRKRYPASARRARKQGTAYVRFSIDANGNVASVSLARSSGVAELDQEVVAMVRRASPVPAPPPGVNRTIMVPVRFSLR